MDMLPPMSLHSITLALCRVRSITRKFAFGLLPGIFFIMVHRGNSWLMNTESLHTTPFKVKMKDA